MQEKENTGSVSSTSFMLSPGEENVHGEKFIATLVAPYLKAEMMCSSTRFVYKVPNTLLGLIPVGSAENQMPISNIVSVASSTSFKFGKFALGAILGIGGLASFSSSFLLGIVLIILGALLLLNAFPASLTVKNAAGGGETLEVSVLESNKLKAFTQELQNRVFADKDQLRHNEAQMQRMMQTQLQQMQLQQMQNNNKTESE